MFCLQTYRFGVARFLLGLYVAVLINGIAFRHAHRLADGTVICHAHPFKASPGTQFPNHAHSRDELIWLDAFTNAMYAHPGAVIWTALVAVVALLTAGSVPVTIARAASPHVLFRHRGPPVHLA